MQYSLAQLFRLKFGKKKRKKRITPFDPVIPSLGIYPNEIIGDTDHNTQIAKILIRLCIILCIRVKHYKPPQHQGFDKEITVLPYVNI